ncbi:MAG: tetratricopeptide repeat protein, partial [Steroidobacteraceae bacterium]|nr:tetratricopeptide repeat protein [Steroidobacteraceae bacterium]MDW8259921.1 tetratricopeptide repeat protein [Gammaproteobacteria bacterium]
QVVLSGWRRFAGGCMVGAALLCTAVAHASNSDWLLHAERLIAERRATEAYEQLRARELEFAGSPRFDYLLGIAALDAGRPAEAIAPLQRVLAVEPRFAGARMELARALYESGAREQAGRQFESLLTDNPPPATRAVIERYLTAIRERAAVDATATRRSAYIDFGSGYDSNANGSTADTQFLGFTLNARNIETSSPFVELAVGGLWGRPLSPRTGLSASARLSHRHNPDAPFVDQSIAFVGGSYLFKVGATRVALGLNGFQGWLDGEQHQRSGNIELGATRLLRDRWELATSLRAGRLDFLQDRLQILDADRYLAGAALTRLNLLQGTARFGMALLAGKDEARRRHSPYGNDRWGARVFGGILLRPQSTLYGEIAFVDTRYEGQGFFGRQRRDEQASAYIGIDWQNWPRAGWTVTPQLRYTNQDSNVSLYRYDRVEALVFIRRSFD